MGSQENGLGLPWGFRWELSWAAICFRELSWVAVINHGKPRISWVAMDAHGVLVDNPWGFMENHWKR